MGSEFLLAIAGGLLSGGLRLSLPGRSEPFAAVAYLRVGESARLGVPDRIPCAAPRWFRARPLPLEYDTVSACGLPPRRGCVAPVRYRLERIATLDGRRRFSSLELLDRPGSARIGFQCRPLTEGADGAEYPDGAIIEPEQIDRLFALVVRRDDSMAGFASELIGAPFALMPTRLASGSHLTDARIATDCVGLVLYGRRRWAAFRGRPVPGYRAPSALLGQPGLLRVFPPGPLPQLPRREPAVLREGEDASVPAPRRLDRIVPIRVDDILHFGFQTALVSRDEPPLGRLNGADFILHSFHGPAEEVRFEALPYRYHPFVVLRWRD